MTDYDSIISRGSPTDSLVPQPVSAQIIQQLPQQSAVLQMAQRVPMSSKTNRLPVLSALPQAYFVTGDTGLKKASKQAWENVTLVAEELAVIVPIPQAYLDDALVPLWDQVRPRITAAFGKAIDLACLFGTGKPSTWGNAIAPSAVTAGNDVVEGTGDDLAVDIAHLAELVAEDGYEVDGLLASISFPWKLIQMRTSQGVPIYAPPAGEQPATIFGYTTALSRNGGFDTAAASLILGDWDYAIVGVRQDLTFQMFTEGVISDDSGNIVLNLMQQDSVAIRAVMRLAFQTANPINELNTNASTRFPFGVLVPAS